MNLRPAVIVDKLEAAYTDSATAQGRVLKKFLPSAAPQGRLRSQATHDVREAPGSKPVEFEDLDKKEMAMALALNVTHGGGGADELRSSLRLPADEAR